MTGQGSQAPPVRRGRWDYYAQLGVVGALFVFFSCIFAWLTRAFITGGVAERIMTTVVIPLLLVIFATIVTTVLIIIHEGKKVQGK